LACLSLKYKRHLTYHTLFDNSALKVMLTTVQGI
jgi:hypothetical protein